MPLAGTPIRTWVWGSRTFGLGETCGSCRAAKHRRAFWRLPVLVPRGRRGSRRPDDTVVEARPTQGKVR